MFSIFDDYHAQMVWRPFGGWSGRSAPERAKYKLPLTRQDVERSTRKMGIPFVPPPGDTDPTLAGALSLLAEQEGLLKQYVVEVMRKEWAEGCDIGNLNILLEVGEEIGLGRGAMMRAAENKQLFDQLDRNWQEAKDRNVFGVPTFVIEDQVFWGNDRIDSLKNHLHDLRLRKL